MMDTYPSPTKVINMGGRTGNDYRSCEDCNGWGSFRTVGNTISAGPQCQTCLGRGWLVGKEANE